MISIIGNIHNITTLFSEDVTTLARLSEVETLTNIKFIKEQLDLLIASKKQQFFRDGSMLEEYFKHSSKDRKHRLKQSLQEE
jgi:hypothetical protein